MKGQLVQIGTKCRLYREYIFLGQQNFQYHPLR